MQALHLKHSKTETRKPSKMCTVTYLPQGQNKFILTSNRDENSARSPQNLTWQTVQGVELVFPRDTTAGGTWIAASDDGRVVCLLNGAFEKHSHRPPYRRSRGLMVLDYFSFYDADSFVRNYVFEGMEPFTFIMVGNGELHELRWDEKEIHFKKLDEHGKHIWSSSTLYTPPIKAKRKQWFEDWLKGRNDFSLEAIQHFHQNGGEKDDWNGFVMNRKNIVQTVSITNIVRGRSQTEMIYNDLLREQVKRASVKLKAVEV